MKRGQYPKLTRVEYEFNGIIIWYSVHSGHSKVTILTLYFNIKMSIPDDSEPRKSKIQVSYPFLGSTGKGVIYFRKICSRSHICLIFEDGWFWR